MSSVAGSFRESLESIAGTIGDVIIIVIIIAVIAFVVKLAGGIQGLFGQSTSTTGTPGSQAGGPGPGGQTSGGYSGQQPGLATGLFAGQPQQASAASSLFSGISASRAASIISAFYTPTYQGGYAVGFNPSRLTTGQANELGMGGPLVYYSGRTAQIYQTVPTNLSQVGIPIILAPPAPKATYTTVGLTGPTIRTPANF